MKLPDRTFKEKMKIQRNRCFYCGEPLTNNKIEVDHKVPFSKSKDGRKSNLWLTCFHCNRIKSDKYIHEFKELCNNKYPEKLIRGLFYFQFINI